MSTNEESMNLGSNTRLHSRIKIAKSFGTAANSYDVSARLQRFTGKQLIPWLAPQPKNVDEFTVLDLGSGTGFFTDILASSYTQVIGFDLSKKMLDYANGKRKNTIHWIEGDAHHLPFQDASIDIIYSNLVIQWCDPLSSAIDEILRVLKPGGSFIFSTLVDGTLHELKSSWAQVDNEPHVINFKTDNQLNALFTSKSTGKLVEQMSQDIVLEYEHVLHLAHELKGLGANYVPSQKNKGLSGKDKWFQMTESYKDFLEPSGVYPATYCVYSGRLVKN
jgi:malonyl-CoA O-methyltransferase